MKKLSKIIACFVLALFTIVGLSGCTTEEIKLNTTEGIESATSVVPIEYSQTVAKDLFSLAISNMIKSSYTMKTEILWDIRSNHDIDYYTDTYGHYYINNSAVFSSYIEYNKFYGQEVSFSGNYYVTKLKDTSNNTEEYYVIHELISDEEEPQVIKIYNLYDNPVEENISIVEFTMLLADVTGGMLYQDGFSYITANNGIQNATIKIKDGLIHEISILNIDSPSQQLYCYESYTFNYDNLSIPNIPTTVQELVADGYVQESVDEAIMKRVDVPVPT